MAQESSLHGGFWNNSTEALNILNPLIALTSPSKDALAQLASIEAGKIPGNAEVAAVFLRAAAKHIPAGNADDDSTGWINSICELAGKAASSCQPRSTISQSGILLSFASLYDRSISARTVEFLQCALLAGQYRYAQRVIGDDWPLRGPNVESVLRYFYLRGMVYIGCDDFQMAVRCFWTVLSVSSDTVSVIAVDAWKKIVLVKCLILQDSVPYQALVSPPSGSSNALSRFLTSSNSPESTISNTSSLGISVYQELAKACHSGSRQAFEKLRSDNVTLWGLDHNLGLIERLATDVEHRCVLHLASVYNILPIAKVAAELGKPEPEAYTILGQTEGLNFTHENGMVSFKVENASALTAEDATSLAQLAETVRRLDVSVSKSSKFQSIKVELGRPPCGVDDF